MEDAAAQLEVQQSQLGPLVRSWRERLDPGSIAALSAAGRPKLGVSQEDIARLIGVSTGWYRKLERGENAGYSEDFLDRVSSVLRLKPDERTLLYLLAV